MRLRNTSDLPRALILEVIRSVRPAGLSRLVITVKGSKSHWGGWAYHGCRRCSVKIGNRTFPMWYEPYQYGQHKGKRYWIADRTELLVVIMAHELRHLWQGRRRANRRGYVWGARGRYSEVDTEAYAIRMLRAWRRRAHAGCSL